MIISVSHLGLYIDGKHGQSPYGDWTLARNLDKGTAAAFVTGHTHIFGCLNDKGEPLFYRVQDQVKCNVTYSNGAPLFQSWKWGNYVGVADFEIVDGQAKLVDYNLIPVNQKQKKKDAEGKSYYEPVGVQTAADPELYNKLKVYQDKGQEQLSMKAGEVVGGDLFTTRKENTKLGTFIANTYKNKTRADVAVVNSGDIRSAYKQGDISYRDILITTPFANTLVTVDFTGSELLSYLEQIVLMENGGYPQYAGITFDYDYNDKKIKNLLIGGKPLDFNKHYKLTTLSFIASGGDRYPNLTTHPSFVDTGFVDAATILESFKANPTIDAEKLIIEDPTWLNKPAEPKS